MTRPWPFSFTVPFSIESTLPMVSGATGVSVAPFTMRTVQKNVPERVRLAVTVRLRMERR